MTSLRSRAKRAMVARSFSIQAAWNYETLIGTGFAYALLPALRVAAAADPGMLPGMVRRHAGFFNSHPYLVTVALGAVARLELDGTPPELTQRFKDALRGPLGSLGDRLFWLSWRPMCALLALVLLLLGAPWWLATGAFLVVYNALHVYVRAWGLEVGVRSGLQVGAVLRASALERGADWAASAGAALAGAVVVLGMARLGSSASVLLPAFAAVLAGLALGTWARSAVWAALGVLWLSAMVGAFASFA